MARLELLEGVSDPARAAGDGEEARDGAAGLELGHTLRELSLLAAAACCGRPIGAGPFPVARKAPKPWGLCSTGPPLAAHVR